MFFFYPKTKQNKKINFFVSDMDSIFRLERNREGCSWAGRGGTRPFAVQPCPVDPLLRAYLPEWVVGFLSDLWKRV